MGNDPWKHRAKGMRCATCMWFVPKEQLENEAMTEKQALAGSIGRCRRHAPTMNGYPVVFEMDWCGDHKLDESK
jgi:Pyruvate/2-oxoacid:ferredoxin oxidoreductase delta subunit